MEGFECKLLSSAWPFDPLSQELLLLQKPPLNSEHNKLLAFSTLNLNTSSLSPFDLNLNLPTEGEEALSSSSSSGVEVDAEDINNNSGLGGVSFLTLDPLGVEEVAPSAAAAAAASSTSGSTSASSTTTSSSTDSNHGVAILRSCFPSQEQQESSRDTNCNYRSKNLGKMPQRIDDQESRSLPKFEEIHFDHPQNTGILHNHTQNPATNHHDSGQDVDVDVDVDDVDGIYFNIQDLDQYDRDGKGYLIEDLMGDDIPPSSSTEGEGGVGNHPNPSFLLQLQPSATLDIDLLGEDEDDESRDDIHNLGQTPHSNSNSFDQLDADLEDKGDTDTYSMDLDLEPPLHLMTEGEEGDKQELKCKFCGFVCCSKSSLGIHERRHTGERPYACKYCGRLFNSAQCCKHHERLHTGDKPFECQYCGKKYAVSTRLKRHERVHTREEPYKCGEPGCGKTFRWFDAFRDHRNTHNGVPLYLCSVCGKSFTSYLKFYYHERGHFLKRERDRDRDRAKKLLQQQQTLNGVVTTTATATTPSSTPAKTPGVKKPKKSRAKPMAKGKSGGGGAGTGGSPNKTRG